MHNTDKYWRPQICWSITYSSNIGYAFTADKCILIKAVKWLVLVWLENLPNWPPLHATKCVKCASHTLNQSFVHLTFADTLQQHCHLSPIHKKLPHKIKMHCIYSKYRTKQPYIPWLNIFWQTLTQELYMTIILEIVNIVLHWELTFYSLTRSCLSIEVLILWF